VAAQVKSRDGGTKLGQRGVVHLASYTYVRPSHRHRQGPGMSCDITPNLTRKNDLLSPQTALQNFGGTTNNGTNPTPSIPRGQRYGSPKLRRIYIKETRFDWTVLRRM